MESIKWTKTMQTQTLFSLLQKNLGIQGMKADVLVVFYAIII